MTSRLSVAGSVGSLQGYHDVRVEPVSVMMEFGYSSVGFGYGDDGTKADTSALLFGSLIFEISELYITVKGIFGGDVELFFIHDTGVEINIPGIFGTAGSADGILEYISDDAAQLCVAQYHFTGGRKVDTEPDFGTL